MERHVKLEEVSCVACELPTFERLNYFTGQFLTERNLSAEQAYHRGKNRLHNRFLHGYGTVCGLKVVEHPNPDCRHRFVVIEPGLALDCCGREIQVQEEVYVDLWQYFNPQEVKENPEDFGKHLLISLCYAECGTEMAPVLFDECSCDETRVEPNRIRESFQVSVQWSDELPEHPRCASPMQCYAEWVHTITVDKPYRLAYDEVNDYLYILSGSNLAHNKSKKSRVYVLDASRNCLLTIFDVDLLGKDIAVSPDGDTVYVGVFDPKVADCPDGYHWVRVFDVSDLTNVERIADVKAGEALGDSALRLVVSPGGDVYALNTYEEMVYAWHPPLQDNSRSIACIKVGRNPRDLIITPDGRWIYVGNNGDKASGKSAEEGSSVSVIKTTHVEDRPHTSDAVLCDTIPVPGGVVALAVSEQLGEHLFVVTESREMYGFIRAEEMHSQIGEPMKLGDEEPVAIQVFRGCGCIFVLVKGPGPAHRGRVLVIDGSKFIKEQQNPLIHSVDVVAGSKDLLLASTPNGLRLYSAGYGAGKLACGGVSVLDILEGECENALWHALEGCPECEDECVLLAVIPEYAEIISRDAAITDDDFDNLVRPIVPSAEALRCLMLCCCEEAAKGKQGRSGPEGVSLDAIGYAVEEYMKAQVKPDLEKLVFQLSTAQDQLNDTQEKVIVLQRKLPGLEDQDKRLTSVESTVGKLTSDSSQQKTRLDEVLVEANSIKETVFRLEGKDTAQGTRLAGIESKVEKLIADLNNLQAQVEEIGKHDDQLEIASADFTWDGAKIKLPRPVDANEVLKRENYEFWVDDIAISSSEAEVTMEDEHTVIISGLMLTPGALVQMKMKGASMPLEGRIDKLDVNKATKEEFDRLLKWSSGPKGGNIVEERTRRGGFEKLEDLLEVSGVGEGIFKANKDRMTLT